MSVAENLLIWRLWTKLRDGEEDRTEGHNEKGKRRIGSKGREGRGERGRQLCTSPEDSPDKRSKGRRWIAVVSRVAVGWFVIGARDGVLRIDGDSRSAEMHGRWESPQNSADAA